MRRGVRQRAAVGMVMLALALGGSVAAAQEEERVVRIDTLDVRDTLYHLSDGGANAMALIDEINGGVVLIDVKSPGWGAAVREAVYGGDRPAGHDDRADPPARRQRGQPRRIPRPGGGRHATSGRRQPSRRPSPTA